MRSLHECLGLNPGSAFMERRVDILYDVNFSIFVWGLANVRGGILDKI